MAQNTDSIRERALQALAQTLATIVEGEPPTNRPAEDGYRNTLEDEHIVRAPLTEMQFRANRAVGILENDQIINHEIQVDRNLLNLTLDMHLRVAPDEVAATCWNAFVTDIHRALRDNSDLGGLIEAVWVQGNSVDPQSFLDREIDGAMFLQLNFKTAEDDPRQRVPGVIPA